MPLVTDEEVKAIIDTKRDTTPFITVADLLVTEDLSGKGLSSDRLEQIELYLAAHFTAITEERGALTQSTVGEASEKYFVDVSPDLGSTRYGQQAIILDSTGTLADLSKLKQGKALFSVFGGDGYTGTEWGNPRGI